MGAKELIVQRRMTYYREPLFEALRHELAARDIELLVAYVEGAREEGVMKDSGALAWARPLRTRYALRARRCGFRVVAAPGVAGCCSNSPVAGTFRDSALPFSGRGKRMRLRKELPPRSLWHFTRRHGEPAELDYFAWPYVRLVVEAAIGSVRRQPSRT